MRKAMSSLVLALVLLATLYAVIVGGSGSSEAACAGPVTELRASPERAAPGEPLRLHGKNFYGDFVCNDTGSSCQFRPNGGRPTDGIRVEFVQGARTWPLATVSSDEDLTFDAGGLKVPADAAPGKAVVRAASPRIDRAVPPPQAETPVLVLGGIPEKGASGNNS